jgi:hypothetical protein
VGTEMKGKCSERAVFSYKNWLKLYFTPRRRL